MDLGLSSLKKTPFKADIKERERKEEKGGAGGDGQRAGRVRSADQSTSEKRTRGACGEEAGCKTRVHSAC